MPQFDSPDRKHNLTQSAGAAEIQIFGTRPQYKWWVTLSAARRENFVEVRILDRLAVEFTPEEARDFARALLKVASD